MRRRAIGCLLVALASACASPAAAPASAPAPAPLTSGDLAAAEAKDAAFALDFRFQSLPGGAIRGLRIAPDGRCEGEYHGMAQHEMEYGKRSGALSASDRKAILVALRDAPFGALARVPEERAVDGEPVSLTVTIGDRSLHVARQMDDLRAAGLEPLCRLLVVVPAHLPLEPR
jgi:hypothetical protein